MMMKCPMEYWCMELQKIYFYIYHTCIYTRPPTHTHTHTLRLIIINWLIASFQWLWTARKGTLRKRLSAFCLNRQSILLNQFLEWVNNRPHHGDSSSFFLSSNLFVLIHYLDGPQFPSTKSLTYYHQSPLFNSLIKPLITI